MNLLSVSVPRSGHHYLVRLLLAVAGRSATYCEFYEIAGCCRTIPCSRQVSPIRLQKNHDFDLTLPTDLPGVRYLVQYRDPVPGALSDRELYAAELGETLASERHHLMLWLAARALWLEDFHAKWIDPGVPDAFVLRYEALVADGEATLRALLRWLELPVQEHEVAAALSAEAKRSGQYGEKHYQGPRQLSGSRFYDAELFAIFETLVADRVAGLVSQRSFAALRDAKHPLTQYWLALRAARRGNRALAVRMLEAISLAQGRPGAAESEIARLLMADAAHEQARPHLAAALAERPDDTALLLRWVELCRAIKDSRAALAEARRLVSLIPWSPNLRVLLALVSGESGERDATLQAVATARAHAPEAPLDWCSLGLALLLVGCHDEADGLLDEALVLWPEHQGLLAVRARNASERAGGHAN